MKKEESLSNAVAKYLTHQYPDVIFHFDTGSGIKLSIGQAVKMKKLNKRGFPDLFICEPKKNVNGLFLELKQAGTRLYKKNGEFASEHLKEQAEILTQLRGKGYMAYFGIGFENTKELIDNYMKL